MTATTNTTVTPTQRTQMHRIISHCRREGMHYEAHVLDQCTYWESFPNSYTTEQVEAAIAVHIAALNADHNQLVAAVAAAAKLVK